MNRLHRRIAIAICLTVGAASAATAQGVPGAGRGRAGAGMRYDTTTVQNIDGTVIRVDTVAGRTGLEGGVHLVTLVGSDTLPVHLGPTWYLAQQATTFAAGDKIRVRGSRTTFEGKPAFIAAEVRHAGGAWLVLRNRHGVPRWGKQPAPPGKARNP